MVGQNTESLFNQIYDETYQAVLCFVTAKCGNVSDIEEIMQETYFDLYSYLDKHKPITNHEAFIVTIAKKKIAKHYSMLKRIIDLFQHDLGQHQGTVGFEDELDAIVLEDTVIVDLLCEEIWNALKTEPQNVQKIFHLYYLCDCSLDSISRELGIGLSDVKNKLYRTLKKLRKFYSGGN